MRRVGKGAFPLQDDSSYVGAARRACTVLVAQASRHRVMILVIYIPVILLFLVLGGIQLIADVDAGRFTRDPLAVAEKPMYFGSVSVLGSMIWFAAAVSCLFSAGLMYLSKGNQRVLRFLLAAGMVSGILVLDDLFMLHEEVLPRLGVPEVLVYGGYFLLLAGFLYSFRSMFLQSRYVVFLAASLAAFSFSLGWDVVEPAISETQWYLIEDGAKFVGIVSWSTFFIATAFHYLSQMISSQRKSAFPV